MALVSSTEYGASYQFGFLAADAPIELRSVFVARSAELRYDSETFVEAKDGEGITDSVVASNPDRKKIDATFTGYLLSGFDVGQIPGSFNFLGRFYIVKSIGVPRKKGEYVEVSVDAQSFYGVTAIAS